ncbi:hypothetical protein [Bacteroides hominis]|uniref:hypothetical protein n=1 Tax=Bacteroides hominis TaxID=2763023 RepID=UPI00164A78B0|nr:hypothetical protein [Bacteroides hominis (ex Liu et al. 2022)]MBC5614618.1 hypothetical protein [Bacteroides hominis (ex Liu et al. 2022)]
MADNGEDYGIQQGNGSNEAFELTDEGYRWKPKHPRQIMPGMDSGYIDNRCILISYCRNPHFYFHWNPPFIPSWLSFTTFTNAFDQPTCHP